MQVTPLWLRLVLEAKRLRPRLIVLDTAADMFGGNEVVRVQARQFITLLRGLAIEIGCGILLLAHPSLEGIRSGTGLSGSTAWHNSVRARAVLTKPDNKAKKKKNDGDDEDYDANDNDLRQLEWHKNNYGRVAEKQLLRWKDGVYALEASGGSVEQKIRERNDEELFMLLLQQATTQHRQPLSSKLRATNYAPKYFAKGPEAKENKVGISRFEDAMRRLLNAGRLELKQYGPPSDDTWQIVVKLVSV